MGVETAILGAAGIGLLGSRSAANTQANAANRATDVQQHMFDQTREDQAPWRQAGGTSLTEIMKQFGLGDGGNGQGYFNHQFGPEDLKAGLAPNYDFMLKQGQGATSNMANAMGGLGGNSLKAINDYTQNYAQNAYQQAFNNYTSNQTNIFNRLASIAGLGQTAGSNSTTGGSNYAQGIAGSIQGAGNANAAGMVGGANAVNQGLGWYAINGMLNPAAAAPNYGSGGGMNPI